MSANLVPPRAGSLRCRRRRIQAGRFVSQNCGKGDKFQYHVHQTLNAKPKSPDLMDPKILDGGASQKQTGPGGSAAGPPWDSMQDAPWAARALFLDWEARLVNLRDDMIR